MAKIKRPKIYHMCSLGSLMGYGGKKGEWSAAKKLKKIKNAGFDGFVGRVFMVTPDEVAASGLVFACTTDLGGIREIRPKLREIKAAGARCVNVQMLDHDTLTERAVEVARRLMDAAEDLEMDVAVEMHRDTCTETPEKTYALAAGYEKAEKKPLKMTWDFSHPAVIKHLSPPYWERLAERVDLIQLAQQFHFRPFNGHHAMIPAIDHKGKDYSRIRRLAGICRAGHGLLAGGGRAGPRNVRLPRADRRRLPFVGVPRPLEGRAGGAPRTGQGVEEAIEEVEGAGLISCI